MRLTAQMRGPGRSMELSETSRARARGLGASAKLIVIAASTGGPSALRSLILNLPAELAVPVVVVQHLPPSFVVSFARQLDRAAPIDVRLAVSGAPASAGTVWFAPGGAHLGLRRGPDGALLFQPRPGPPLAGCLPAADVLFEAAAQTCGRACLGVVLSGMGRDGSKGAREIVAAGGKVLVQDQASSTVWGMPGSVLRAGVEAQVVALEHMANELQRAAS